MIVRPEFLTCWKLALLTRRLDDRASVAYVLALWAHCETSRKSTLNVTPEMLAAICRYDGDPALLMASMIECRFLDKTDAGLVVHEWDEYNSALVANWENGRRGGRPRKPIDNPEETQRKPRGNPEETQMRNGLTQKEPIDNPKQTQRKPTDNPLETEGLEGEEGLERKEETPPLSPLGGTDGLTPSSEPSKPKTETQWTESGGWQNITQEKKDRWKVAYPACDIDRQMAAMDAWLRANPAKAHKSRWDAFIVNWLKRSQDRGGDCQSQRAAYGPQRRNSEPIDYSKGFWGDKK